MNYEQIIETLAELSNELPEFEELPDFTPVEKEDFIFSEFSNVWEDR